jgi:tetratricopeptide (TPR) repeat protein
LRRAIKKWAYRWLSVSLLAFSLSSPVHAQQTPAQSQPAISDEQQARDDLKQAEHEHPGNTPEVVTALTGLIQTQIATHTSEETVALAARAVKVAEAAAGKDSDLYSSALAIQSSVYLIQDRPDLAHPLAEESLEIEEKLQPTTPKGLAVAAGALSAVCKKEGDQPCALRNVELQVKALREEKDVTTIDLVNGLIDLVDDRRLSGNTAGARAALEEVLAIAARDPETEPPWAIVESNAAAFFMFTREYQLALVHLKRALELDAKLYGADSIAECAATANLAYSEMALGKAADALTHYGRARTLCARQYGPNHSVTGLVNSGYALALTSLERFPEAVQIALDAHRTSREYIALAMRLLPEREALTIGGEGDMAYSILLTVASRHPDAGVPAVYQEVVRSRALVAEEMAQRAAGLSRKRDPAVASLEQQLETERKAVMDLEATGATADQAELNRSIAAMEKTERQLANRSAAFRTDERTRSSDLADLRRNIPAGSVLIS